MTFNFQQNLRPYPSQVAELKAGTGVLPLDNAACLLLSVPADRDQILQLAIAAAVAAQGTNTLGIQAPPPQIAATSGLANPANDLVDELFGSTAAVIGYYSPDAPRAYLLSGTVIIPDNPNAPAEVKATVTVQTYVGQLVNAWKAGNTKLVMTYSDSIAQFAWA